MNIQYLVYAFRIETMPNGMIRRGKIGKIEATDKNHAEAIERALYTAQGVEADIVCRFRLGYTWVECSSRDLWHVISDMRTMCDKYQEEE